MTSFLSVIPVVAQVANEEIDLTEVTPGTIAAGSLVLCALAGSLIVIASWISRWTNGQPVIPVASRSMLRIPALLTGLGLLLAGFMALTTLLVRWGISNLPLHPVQMSQKKIKQKSISLKTSPTRNLWTNRKSPMNCSRKTIV